MKNILLIIFILLSLTNCITDEKTKCHKEGKEKTNAMFAGFNECRYAIISATVVGSRYGSSQTMQDFVLINCLVEYSTYLECKDESPFAPTVY